MAFKMKGFPYSGKSPMKQDEMGLGTEQSGNLPTMEAGGGGGKHPLYKELTPDEQKAYDALTPEEKVNVDKNTTISQLKNALGGPGEEDDPN